MTSEKVDQVLSVIDRALGDPEPNSEQWVNINAVGTTHCPRTREEADANATETRIGVLRIDGQGSVTYFNLGGAFAYVPHGPGGAFTHQFVDASK